MSTTHAAAVRGHRIVANLVRFATAALIATVLQLAIELDFSPREYAWFGGTALVVPWMAWGIRVAFRAVSGGRLTVVAASLAMLVTVGIAVLQVTSTFTPLLLLLALGINVLALGTAAPRASAAAADGGAIVALTLGALLTGLAVAAGGSLIGLAVVGVALALVMTLAPALRQPSDRVDRVEVSRFHSVPVVNEWWPLRPAALAILLRSSIAALGVLAVPGFIDAFGFDAFGRAFAIAGVLGAALLGAPIARVLQRLLGTIRARAALGIMIAVGALIVPSGREGVFAVLACLGAAAISVGFAGLARVHGTHPALARPDADGIFDTAGAPQSLAQIAGLVLGSGLAFVAGTANALLVVAIVVAALAVLLCGVRPRERARRSPSW